MQSNETIPGVSDTGGTVNLSIYDCKKTGDCCHQWRCGRCCATMFGSDGYPFSVRESKNRLCIWKNWYHPRSMFKLVSTQNMSVSASALSGYTPVKYLMRKKRKKVVLCALCMPQKDLMEAAYTLARSIAKKSQVSITLARPNDAQTLSRANTERSSQHWFLGYILC